MEEKKQKAKEIHALVEDLNQKVYEAKKMGLTVEFKSSYSRSELEPALLCNVGEYTPYP